MFKPGTMLRSRAVALAAALAAGPAAAASPETDLVAWLAANTDLSAAQIVITGPDHVYSLEPLGPRTPAGEVIALVRTESLSRDPDAARGAASWDAHLLFDCADGRLRQIRSATYPQRNRKGVPRPETPGEGWMSPQPGEPAARLLAAACDPAFVWALRSVALRPPGSLPLPPPPVVAAQTFSVQVARGPSEDGARRALAAARKTLGPLARDLADTTEVTSLGAARRFTVRLAGFPDQAAATEACRRLNQAGQDCFPWQETADAAAPAIATTAAAAPAAAQPSGYVVQVVRGPSEEGAQRALKAARKALGPATRGLTGTIETSQIGPHRRYTALLGGFATAADAVSACAVLTKAGQTCYARPAGDDA